MTNDELREAIKDWKMLSKESYIDIDLCFDKKSFEKLKLIVQVAEGVLRLPEKCCCIKCGGKLIYCKSTFEQYEPSVYKCEKCPEEFSTSQVEMWNAYREEERKVIGLE